MKKLLSLSLVGLTAGCMMQEPLSPEMHAQTETLVAEELQGFAPAGPPRSCVRSVDLVGNRSAGEGAVIFRSRSRNLVYVNRPPGGCPIIRPGMALRTQTSGSQLCRGDIAEVFDPLSGFGRGACGLGVFEPYRRLR
jgi:hypothetical protein